MGERVRPRLLSRADRSDAIARLRERIRPNLTLLEIVDRIGRTAVVGEIASQAAGVWKTEDGHERLVGVAALRPSLVLDAGMDPALVEELIPYFQPVQAGLAKSPAPLVDVLWKGLAAAGRRALIDRIETSFALEPSAWRSATDATDSRARVARPEDLPALVHAARASLREEGRPDPFDGDPSGFRRWVAARLSRARVVEASGRVVFVGYADVQRPEGWLVQGVYTWPEQRRRGHARTGMSFIAEEAFDAGADHVQLAVVEGNEAGLALYRGLGFEPAERLRTILFV